MPFITVDTLEHKLGFLLQKLQETQLDPEFPEFEYELGFLQVLPPPEHAGNMLLGVNGCGNMWDSIYGVFLSYFQ